MKHQLIALLAVMTVSLTGCASLQNKGENHVINMAEIGIPETTEPPTEPAFYPADVSIAAVGDNLIHTCVYKTASAHSADGVVYDFHYCYDGIADRIAKADLAFINQETLICNGKLELSGTRVNFNSPVELGYNLADIGFDVFNMANSDVLDKGAEGLGYTLDYWDALREDYPDVTVLGAYRNQEDMQNYRIVEKDGLKIGFLGYTEHTNERSLPEDSEMIVPYIGDSSLMQMQIQELSPQVDCLIVSMYWGQPDTHTVDDSIRELAQKMIDWGADVILGTGSHTLQTMEYLTRADGSKGFVFYSLGNVISGQTDNFNMVGGLGEFHVCRDTDGNITIEDVGLTPLITHYDTDMTNVRTFPYDAYKDRMMNAHYLPHTSGGSYKRWSWEVVDAIVEENVPEEFRRNYTANSQNTETESETDSSTETEE